MNAIRRPQNVRDAIFADEVGMQFGRYGDYVIKSAYQPILHVEDGQLITVAVEGLATVFKHGRQVTSRELFSSIPAGDRIFMESMCRALHIRNFRPSGLDHLNLYFNFDPGSITDLQSAIGEIRFTAHRLGELHIDPRTLVCEITEAKALDDTMLLELVREVRRYGMRVAVDDFGSGQSNWERCDLISPEIAKIDAEWFQRLAGESGTRHLLNHLMTQFAERGIETLIEGIETPSHLHSAIEAGAQRFQGFLFGKPSLAGAGLDDRPRSLDTVLEAAPSFTSLRSRQQKRAYF